MKFFCSLQIFICQGCYNWVVFQAVIQDMTTSPQNFKQVWHSAESFLRTLFFLMQVPSHSFLLLFLSSFLLRFPRIFPSYSSQIIQFAHFFYVISQLLSQMIAKCKQFTSKCYKTWQMLVPVLACLTVNFHNIQYLNTNLLCLLHLEMIMPVSAMLVFFLAPLKKTLVNLLFFSPITKFN